MPSLLKMLEHAGHADLNTTAIYLHADRAGGVSPMDARNPVPIITPARIEFETV